MLCTLIEFKDMAFSSHQSGRHGVKLAPYCKNTGSHIEDLKGHLYTLYAKYCDIAENKRLTGQLKQEAEELAKKLFLWQLFRLGSFNIHLEEYANYSATQLAQDGFYRSPSEGEIQCFSCGYKHNVRQSRRNPFTAHRASSGSCLHLRGEDTRNVPLTVPLSDTSPETSTTGRSQENLHQSTVEAPTERMAVFSSSQNHTRQVPEIRRPPESADMGTSSSSSVRDQRKRNLHRKVAFMDYRYELCRLQSYKHWPSNAAAVPEELANAGFYYMGTDDRVQCVFCRGILRCWEPDDKALAEHLRHFPQCPFLLDPQSVGNVPLGEEDERLFSAVQARNEDHELPGEQTLEGVVVSGSPVHPDKAHISARLATFQEFPSNAFQKGEDLAKAGFFYTGQIDSVRCYFCNVMVSNWKPSDDPWVIHANKSDKCGFLLISRGKSFIEDVKTGKHQTKNKRRKAHTKRRTLPVNQADVHKFMSSSTIRAVQEDYDDRLLLKVVTRRFQELGEGFPNPESLIDAILEFEDEPEDEPELADCINDETTAEAEGQKSDIPEYSEGAEPGTEDNEELDSETLLAQNQALYEETRCKVCLEERASIVFLKCGHMVCCSSCAPALTKCPICRERILGTIRVEL